MKQSKNKRLIHKLSMTLFLSFIFTFGIVHVLATDKDFSEQENRVLTQFPSFTWDRFFSGKFMKDFEEYVNDQFVGRSFWVGLKADAEQALLKQENNGIYFGKDGFLLEPFEKPGEQFCRNLQYMKALAERVSKRDTISFYFLLAPTSIEIYNESKPWLAKTEPQQHWLSEAKKTLADSITFIDVYETFMQHKEESIYFRTDHHWTMRGAYYAYLTAAEAMGIEPYALDKFEISEVSDDFYGTFYTKAPSKFILPDRIELFQPSFDVTYRVTYENDPQSTTDSLYAWDFLDKKDQYAVFLGGNHSLVKIETSVKNGRKLAVVKDSYAHAMLPFLANHFEEIHVFDLRYNHTSLTKYMEQEHMTDVLFLYNMAQFSTDTNMIWLKQ